MWSTSEADRAAIAWMLSPVSIEEFAEQYYEKAPLHIARNQAGFFDRYFSLADLETVLFGNQLRTRDISIAKDGTLARTETYVFPKTTKRRAAKEPVSEIVDPDRLSALFSGGCSVVLDAVQNFSTKVATLKREMEQCFRHPVNANLYLTPPGNQGFAAHYDTHDTWIVQIEGCKHWRVYTAPFDLPLDEQLHDKRTQLPGDVLMEIDMRPGDLLYIPRGFMHEGRANDDLSMHLTFGLYPRRAIQVLDELLNAAADDKANSILRQTFSADMLPALLEYLRSALTQEALTAADGRLEAKFLKERRNGLDGQISEVMRLKNLSEASYISMRPHMMFSVSSTEKATHLTFSGKTLTFGPGAAAIIHELENVSAVQVGTLLKHDEKALAIVRKLIQEGFALQRPTAPHAVAAGVVA